MSGRGQSSSPTQTELWSSGRAQSEKAATSTRGVALRPSVRFKSSSQTGDSVPGVMMIIPLSEKRTASMPVTPVLESSLGSPGPSSIHQVPSNATVSTEVIKFSEHCCWIKLAVE
jgi:hypothetical protein